ncbi:MFS transporter [Streptomyces sp. Da 82-17]|uniref:MFS transporter n=1 Tax=Streptomyces sp. Da 82-17 TaxID=3377116 RepID=UPI0038D3FB64
MSDTAMASAGTHGAEPDPRRKKALFVVLFAAFMDLLDSTIVNIALPSIQHDLDAGYAAVQWVVAAYLLAFAVLLILGGRLGDMFGRKKMFLLGIAAFTLTSLACGIAHEPELLVALRALQGASAALMVPQVLSIITAIFPPQERGAAFGAFGAVAGLATVGGPIVSSVLIDADLWGLGWRSIFLLNVPVGVVLLYFAVKLVPESKSPWPVKLDVAGTALVTLGLLLLLFPLVQGREAGWPAWSFVSLALSLPVLLLFALHQRRRGKVQGASLVEPGLFRNRSFTGGIAANLIFFVVVTGHFLIFIIFLQNGLGFSPLRAGLTGLPWSFGTSIGAGISSALLTARIGRKALLIGAVLLATGLTGLALTIGWRGEDIGSWSMLPALFVAGLGMGFIVAPVLDFILSAVPPQSAGSGSGIVNAVQQVGGAVGVAVIGAVFFGLLGSGAATAAQDAAPKLRAELAEARVAPAEAREITATFQRCFTDRTTATDPTAVPPGCGSLTEGPAPVAAAVAAADADARREAFGTALQRTVIAQVALTACVFGLLLLLPRKLRHQEWGGGEDDGHGADADRPGHERAEDGAADGTPGAGSHRAAAPGPRIPSATDPQSAS